MNPVQCDCGKVAKWAACLEMNDGSRQTLWYCEDCLPTAMRPFTVRDAAAKPPQVRYNLRGLAVLFVFMIVLTVFTIVGVILGWEPALVSLMFGVLIGTMIGSLYFEPERSEKRDVPEDSDVPCDLDRIDGAFRRWK